jgi:hypothetical protein
MTDKELIIMGAFIGAILLTGVIIQRLFVICDRVFDRMERSDEKRL